jgi:signal peptidase I
VLFLLLGMAWLAAGIGVFGSLLFVRLRNRPFLSGVLMLLVVVVGTIAFRVFVAEIYTVPSESMENTLRDGDNIVMSKLNYGPRLPMSVGEIPWSGLFYLLAGRVPADGGASPWTYRRLSGFSRLQRGDVIVFKMPDERGETLIKRCVGRPGDVLRIVDGDVMDDAHRLLRAATLKRQYKIRISDPEHFSNLMEGLGITYELSPEDRAMAYAYTTVGGNDSIRRSGTVLSIEPVITPYGDAPGVYPYDSCCKWTIDNYGPVVIPARGMKIKLTRSNFVLYKSLFDRYEKADLREAEGRFYTPAGEIREYTFREDYCFVLGDNRDVSNDSRYWGFVPLRNIEGKAIFILYSYAGRHFDWGRAFTWL